MSERLFLDFDETLFDHMKMLGWLDGVMASTYGLQPGEFAAGVDDHHDQIDAIHRLYRHRDHYGVSGRDWGEISDDLRARVAAEGVDFCYPDVHPFLGSLATRSDIDVRLLTFGDEEYQLYKMALCRELTRLDFPVMVVREPKRDFLARAFPDGGTLVDDKYPLRLPHGWQHVLIDRSGAFASTEFGEGVRRITSLEDVGVISE